MGKKIRIGVLQLVVNGGLVYFFHGTMEKQLLFIPEPFNALLLKYSLYIFIILIVCNIILYIFSLRDHDHIEKKKIQDNICRKIFETYIINNDHLANEDIKISILVKRYGIIWLNKYLPSLGYYFIACGRYQSKQPVKKSKVKFILNQGAVGKAYELNQIVSVTMPIKYSKKTKVEYIRHCEEVLNIPEWKTEKLNDKSYVYICIPIRKYQTNEVIAIMSIDSTKKITKLDTRSIEDYITFFEPIFDHNRII